jgi:hypothetical protein
MWLIGIVGLIFIFIGHLIAWPSYYTYDDKDKVAEVRKKIVKSCKTVGGIWFIVWLLPPMFKVWIAAVLS